MTAMAAHLSSKLLKLHARDSRALLAAGAGAGLAAAFNAPLTGASGIFVPLLAACTGAIAVPAALGQPPIYDLLRERDARKRDEVAKRQGCGA